MEFCDGAQEGGLVEYVRRGRMVASDLREALAMLESERSARVPMQDQRDRLMRLLVERGVNVT